MLRRTCSRVVSSSRSVYIHSKKGSRKPRSFVYEKAVAQNEAKQLDFKLKQLQNFSMDLKAQIKRAEEIKRQEKLERELAPASTAHQLAATELDHVIATENASVKRNGPDLSSFLLKPTFSAVPKVLEERLGDSIVFVVNKRNQQWNPIIDKLYNGEKLAGLSKKQLVTWLQKLGSYKDFTFESIIKMDEMMVENGAKFNSQMYDFLLRSMGNLPSSTWANNEKVLNHIDCILDRMKNDGIRPSEYSLSYIVSYTRRLRSIKAMDKYLKLFREEYNVTPNRTIYTQILQMYIDFDQYDSAMDVFTTLKFLSQETKPDVVAYNSMITLANKHNKQEAAIDLFTEMVQDNHIKPSLNTLNLMAKACSKSDQFRLGGWKYIHQTEEFSYVPNKYTLHAMMSLAAYDGDLAMCRALYFKLLDANSQLLSTTLVKNPKEAIDPVAFNLLQVAYSRYNPASLPLLMGYEKGAILRRNTLNSVDYTGLGDNHAMDQFGMRVPLLPVVDLVTRDQILAESSAVWAFNVLRDTQRVLNTRNVVSYLSIAIKMESFEEFKKRFDGVSYSEVEKWKSEQLEVVSQEETVSPEEVSQDVTVLPQAILSSSSLKIPRNSEIYEIAMKAATHFEQLEYGKKIWEERGLFRKTQRFQSQPREKRVEQDARFAQLMVDHLVKCRLLLDAMAVVTSSSGNIDWTFNMVRNLYKELIQVEDKYNGMKLLDIVNSK